MLAMVDDPDWVWQGTTRRPPTWTRLWIRSDNDEYDCYENRITGDVGFAFEVVEQRIIRSDTFVYRGPARGWWRFILRQHREVVREWKFVLIDADTNLYSHTSRRIPRGWYNVQAWPSPLPWLGGWGGA